MRELHTVILSGAKHLLVGALLLGATSLGAQTPPIRKIATATALSTERIGSIAQVRELPDGRVLVNDGGRRRLILMDTTLAVSAVVLDSLAEVENTYGTRVGRLIPYRADSSIFIDPASFVMMIIDPAGRVTRVRSVWRVEDMQNLVSDYGPGPQMVGTDARGRIVYRVGAQPARPRVAPPRGVPWFPQEPDSAFVGAVDIDTRKIDTLGAVRTPKNVYYYTQSATGGFNFNQLHNPLPLSDDWAVLPNGTVAFVRVRDYSVEYLDADGTRDTSAKLPYDWVRLSDEMKQALVDSLRRVQLKQNQTQYVTQMIRWVNQYGKKKYPDGFVVPEGYTVQQGYPRDWALPPGLRYPEKYIFGCAIGEEPRMIEATPAPGRNSSAASAAPGAAAPAGPPGPPGPLTGTPSCIPSPTMPSFAQAPTLRDVRVIDALELPDYRPPLNRPGLTRADEDGNLWIQVVQAKPVPGGAVYDVVSREHGLVDRIQIPPGYTLVGFGRGGVVYLSMRDAKGIHLARVRLRSREP